MPKKEILKPFFQRHLWVMPIYGFLAFIFSPIIIPIVLFKSRWEDIKDYYKQCFDAFRKHY